MKTLILLSLCGLLTSTAWAENHETDAPAEDHAGHAPSSPVTEASPAGEVTQASHEHGTGMMGMMARHHQRHRAWFAGDASQETLAGSDIDHGFYVAPEVKLSRFIGDTVVLAGGRGAWLLNHRFAVGGAGYHTINRVEAPNRFQVAGDYTRNVRMGYGGLLLEYTIAPKKAFHAAVSAILGGGMTSSGMGMGMGHGDRYDDDSRYDGRIDGAGFFVAEPEARVELNVTRHFRAALGGGYRFVTGVERDGLEVSDLQGPTGSLLLKFGVF